MGSDKMQTLHSLGFTAARREWSSLAQFWDGTGTVGEIWGRSCIPSQVKEHGEVQEPAQSWAPCTSGWRVRWGRARLGSLQLPSSDSTGTNQTRTAAPRAPVIWGAAGSAFAGFHSPHTNNRSVLWELILYQVSRQVMPSAQKGQPAHSLSKCLAAKVVLGWPRF